MKNHSRFGIGFWKIWPPFWSQMDFYYEGWPLFLSLILAGSQNVPRTLPWSPQDPPRPSQELRWLPIWSNFAPQDSPKTLPKHPCAILGLCCAILGLSFVILGLFLAILGMCWSQAEQTYQNPSNITDFICFSMFFIFFMLCSWITNFFYFD